MDNDNKNRSVKSPSEAQEQVGSVFSRRRFVLFGFGAGFSATLGTLFVPFKSFAQGFNTGAFWKKRSVTTRGLWAAGSNAIGEIGDGTIISKSSPVQVGALTNWSSVSAGASHIMAIKTDGTLWAWGLGTVGRLGHGATTSVSSPIQIGALTTWSQVSCALYGNSCGIRTDGTLWSWGAGTAGGLGIGSITSRSSPVQVGALTNWSSVGAMNQAGVAIKTDGTLWSWGANNYGQLGHGNGTYLSSPVQVGALTNWSKVAAGYEHVLALKTDGTLWSWGNGASGQLGSGSNASRSSPVQVGALTTWSKISCGVYHSAMIQTDGTLWGTGENYAGQAAGRTMAATPSSPVQVGTLTTWSQVQAAHSFTAALKTDGTLWTYGDGSNGQLMVGNTSARSSPTQVGTLTKWVALGTGARVLPFRST